MLVRISRSATVILIAGWAGISACFAQNGDWRMGYWYYCWDPPGYYPYVTACRSKWQPVPIPSQMLPGNSSHTDNQLAPNSRPNDTQSQPDSSASQDSSASRGTMPSGSGATAGDAGANTTEPANTLVATDQTNAADSGQQSQDKSLFSTPSGTLKGIGGILFILGAAVAVGRNAYSETRRIGPGHSRTEHHPRVKGNPQVGGKLMLAGAAIFLIGLIV